MLSSQQLTIREYPIAMWLIAGALLAGGGYSFYQDPGSWVVLTITGLLALLILLLSSVLVVKVDTSSGTLTISHLSAIRRKVRNIPISEVASIYVEQTTNSGDNGSSTTYRVVVALRDGEIVPFRSYYSSGFTAKGEKARKLRDYLGVGGDDQREGNVIEALSSMAQKAYLETIDLFANSPVEEKLVRGARWQIQKVAHHGTCITRIRSDEFKMSGFLYLAQKGKNQNFARSGPFASLLKTLFQQSIGIYGFSPEDTPDQEFSEIPTSFEPRLDVHYVAFTNDPERAPKLIGQMAVTALVDWAEQHPLKMLTSGDNPGQLVILFSPNGLYLGSIGILKESQIAQLASLGTELLRANEYTNF